MSTAERDGKQARVKSVENKKKTQRTVTASIRMRKEYRFKAVVDEGVHMEHGIKGSDEKEDEDGGHNESAMAKRRGPT